MDKFSQFLKTSLDTYDRLREAERVIALEKEELSIANNTENNLRLQLTRTQDRLVTLQKEVNKISGLLEQMKDHEKAIAEQGKTISLLVSVIEEQRRNVSQKVSSVSAEVTLSIQVLELRKRLEEQDNLLNLVRIENQVAFNKKNSEIEQLTQQLKEITKEKTKAVWDKEMLENSVDRIQLLHDKKISELTEKIQKLQNQTTEKPMPWDKRLHVTWADAARQTVQENVVSSQGLVNEIPPTEERRPIFTLKTPRKTQAPLDIHAVKDDSNQPKKKRLFSNNSDPFLA